MNARGSLALVLVLAALGCKDEPVAQAEDAPRANPPAPDVRKVAVGRNVTLEIQGERRRVLIDASVCLREGMLEQFLCCKHTKEHEAILTADVDARDIHKALLVTGAKPGSPVKYEPRLEPPTGTRIKVSVQYEEKGKRVTRPAQEWIRTINTKKDLAADWVFAGSRLIPNGDDRQKPPFYGANGGDVICVSNFPDAMLDLAIPSSKANVDLAFEAHTERIPALATRVVVILEPHKAP